MASKPCKNATTNENSNCCHSNTDLMRPWLETIIRKECQDEGINKILDYKMTKASAKGDNYTSDLTRVNMDIINGCGKSKKISIIIKELPSTEYKRATFSNMGFFLRETLMYREILPNMTMIMEEFQGYADNMWGKCLDYRPYDKIVLEDLVKDGFTIKDRLLGLDYDHCLLVMKSLAKFHALSTVLKSRGQIPMEVFSRNLIQNMASNVQMGQFYQHLLLNFIKTVKTQWEDKWLPTVDRLNKLVPNVMDKLSSLLERDETKFNVLNHGDCWLNNMLFKYGIDSDKPIVVKFIDFQLCFYNTPAYDLQYFLSTTTNYEVRNEHKWKLVEEYHKSLINFLKIYNYEGIPLTLENLKDEMKRLTLFTLINGLIVLPIVLLERPEETPDMEEMIKETMESNKVMNIDWLQHGGENYNKYMKLILEEVVKYNQI